MPAYPGAGKATIIDENAQAFFWQGEAIAAVGHSVAYQLRRVRGTYYPWGFAVEVAFSAAPGAFEVDIEAAETDDANHYVKIASISTVNANNVGRVDITSSTPFFGKFVRLTMTSLTNAVNTTALLSR